MPRKTTRRKPRLKNDPTVTAPTPWPIMRDERICPHGVGHPIPDMPHHADGVHGCDGCCTGEWAKLNPTAPVEAAQTLDPDNVLGGLPPELVGDVDAQARLAEVVPELYALATNMPMLDAQIRRGAMLGVPRLKLLRANALVRYVRTGDAVPAYPHAIAPIAPF